MLKVRLVKDEGLRRVFVIAFYIAFAAAAAYWMLHARSVDEKVLYGVVSLFVPFGLWYEFIRYHYAESVRLLNEECAPEEALKSLKLVRRLDFLQRYRIQRYYQEGFAMIAQDRAAEVPAFIAENLDKNLARNKNVDFEYNYLWFLTFAALGDEKQLTVYHGALEKIFEVQRKMSHDIAALKYAVDGIYFTLRKKTRNAQTAFENVRMEALSRHEQARCYYYKAVLAGQMQQTEAAGQNYERVMELAPKVKMFADHRP